MQLDCPDCGRTIHADDINLDTALAKCRQCHSVFSFAHRVGRGDANAGAGGPRPETGKPESIGILQAPDHLLLTRRWFSPAYIFLIFFCVFWDGFLVVWYFIAFTQGSPMIMKVFPLGHLAVGVGLTWFTVAGILNTTSIRVDYQSLAIRHHPVPWPGNRTIEAAHVAQVYGRRSMVQKNGRHMYNVFARTVDGGRIKIVSGLQDADEALYIEQEIERFLDLEDVREPEELKS